MSCSWHAQTHAEQSNFGPFCGYPITEFRCSSISSFSAEAFSNISFDKIVIDAFNINYDSLLSMKVSVWPYVFMPQTQCVS